jgi:indole-3-glycerol phosphate synthase
MSMLREIVRNKKNELDSVKCNVPLSELKARLKDLDPARSFKEAIARNNGPVRLIAELKKASPSKGLIRADFDLPEIISVYNAKDVAAVSVLTEQRFFGGSLDFLGEARKKTQKPLLRKDFIFDDYQVYEARANNADALLLIAAALEKSQLHDLYGLSRELSLDCLVEVHNWKELDSALSCDSEIIGINNRDLSTLNISLNVTFEMLKDIPEEIIVVSESGIKSRTDVESMQSTRVDAILVGTTIMQADDISAKIDELLGKEKGTEGSRTQGFE